MAQHETVKVYTDPRAALRDLELRWRTEPADPADVLAPDGNTYTFYGQCQGCVRHRESIWWLENSVSELQDLVAEMATVLKTAGLLDQDDGTK